MLEFQARCARVQGQRVQILVQSLHRMEMREHKPGQQIGAGQLPTPKTSMTSKAPFLHPFFAKKIIDNLHNNILVCNRVILALS